MLRVLGRRSVTRDDEVRVDDSEDHRRGEPEAGGSASGLSDRRTHSD